MTRLGAKTGRNWTEWVRVLDAGNAAAMPHCDITALVLQEARRGRRWAQTVIVG